MNSATDLFAYAEERKRRGIALSAENAGDPWQIAALAFLRDFLMTRPEMFVDELWEAGLPRPRSPRALGAVIQRAAHLNWISEQTDTAGNILARPSNASNGQLKRVWRSNLFGNA